eukprot:9050103-Alexandrium_andersonii.AAC.1
MACASLRPLLCWPAFWEFQVPEHSALSYENTAFWSALSGPALCVLRSFQCSRAQRLDHLRSVSYTHLRAHETSAHL